jgi:trigger factor
MSLKSSNKVETNRYQLEVEVDAETFAKAVDQVYHKQSKKNHDPGLPQGQSTPRIY